MDEQVESHSADALRKIVDEAEHGPVDKTHLKALIRKRYLFHATRYARITSDRRVLPKEFTSTVASAVWLEATGSGISPSTASRTPTLTSIGQYLSRLARVSVDPDRGLDLLNTDAQFNEAEARGKVTSDVRSEGLREAAFETVRAGLTEEERWAIVVIRRLIQEHEHLSQLFIRELGAGFNTTHVLRPTRLSGGVEGD